LIIRVDQVAKQRQNFRNRDTPIMGIFDSDSSNKMRPRGRKKYKGSSIKGESDDPRPGRADMRNPRALEDPKGDKSMGTCMGNPQQPYPVARTVFCQFSHLKDWQATKSLTLTHIFSSCIRHFTWVWSFDHYGASSFSRKKCVSYFSSVTSP
jgi:hypothetical protein